MTFTTNDGTNIMKLSNLESVQDYVEFLDQLKTSLQQAKLSNHTEISISFKHKGGLTTINYLSEKTLAIMQAEKRGALQTRIDETIAKIKALGVDVSDEYPETDCTSMTKGDKQPLESLSGKSIANAFLSTYDQEIEQQIRNRIDKPGASEGEYTRYQNAPDYRKWLEENRLSNNYGNFLDYKDFLVNQLFGK